MRRLVSSTALVVAAVLVAGCPHAPPKTVDLPERVVLSGCGAQLPERHTYEISNRKQVPEHVSGADSGTIASGTVSCEVEDGWLSIGVVFDALSEPFLWVCELDGQAVTLEYAGP